MRVALDLCIAGLILRAFTSLMILQKWVVTLLIVSVTQRIVIREYTGGDSESQEKRDLIQKRSISHCLNRGLHGFLDLCVLTGSDWEWHENSP